MHFTASLTKNHEFRRVYNRGKTAGASTIALYVFPNRLGKNRLGITVTTKIGGAVVRNRIRRRIKEIYRLSEGKLRPSFDVVIVARSRASTATYWQIRADFQRLAKKMGLLVVGE